MNRDHCALQRSIARHLRFRRLRIANLDSQAVAIRRASLRGNAHFADIAGLDARRLRQSIQRKIAAPDRCLMRLLRFVEPQITHRDIDRRAAHIEDEAFRLL